MVVCTDAVSKQFITYKSSLSLHLLLPPSISKTSYYMGVDPKMQCMLTNAMRGLRNWTKVSFSNCVFFMGLTHDAASQPWGGGKFSSSCIKFRTVFNCHPREVLQLLEHISVAFPWPRFLHLFKYLNIHW